MPRQPLIDFLTWTLLEPTKESLKNSSDWLIEVNQAIQDFQDIFSDFMLKNSMAWQLSNKFNIGIATELITTTQLDSIFPKNILPPDSTFQDSTSQKPLQGWERFYEDYPDSPGFFNISRVGFNAEKTKALLYVENYYGNLGAEGKLFFLIKQNGIWIVQDNQRLWSS